jgi:hypothetical protein
MFGYDASKIPTAVGATAQKQTAPVFDARRAADAQAKIASDKAARAESAFNTGGGSGRQTSAPYGVDQMTPGVEEQNWHYNQNRWRQTPGLDWVNQSVRPELSNLTSFGQGLSYGPNGSGDQAWNKVNGSMNDFRAYGGNTNAQTAFNRMFANDPGSVQPQFDAAYDRARDLAVGEANNQAAARGVYGSSGALNNVGNVITDIEAARANRASDFALQNAAEQRNFSSALGGLGSAADSSELSRIGAQANIAFSGDSQMLDREIAAANAAGNAQEAQRLRSQLAFQNQMELLRSVLGFTDAGYERIIGGDRASQEDIWRARGADSLEGYQFNQEQQNRARAETAEGIRTGVALYTGGGSEAAARGVSAANTRRGRG